MAFPNSLSSLMAAGLLCSALPAWSQELPEGKGKEMVDAMCNSCHPLTARVGSGYNVEGWRTVMRMMTNFGVSIEPDQLGPMTIYLAKTYPEKPKPAGAVIAGPANVSMNVFPVPTPGSGRTIRWPPGTARSGTRAR